MSNLDKKLDEAITMSFTIWHAHQSQAEQDAPNRVNWFRPNNGELWFFAFDHDMVKQAFIDDGWVKIPTASITKEGWIEVSTDRGVSHNGVPLMTGEEWYGKFMEELPKDVIIKYDCHQNVSFHAGNNHGLRVARDAARKATGIEESERG